MTLHCKDIFKSILCIVLNKKEVSLISFLVYEIKYVLLLHFLGLKRKTHFLHLFMKPAPCFGQPSESEPFLNILCIFICSSFVILANFWSLYFYFIRLIFWIAKNHKLLNFWKNKGDNFSKIDFQLKINKPTIGVSYNYRETCADCKKDFDQVLISSRNKAKVAFKTWK